MRESSYIVRSEVKVIAQRKQYLHQLISKKNNGRVKIITGIRRCGKSFLLFKIGGLKVLVQQGY